MPDDSDLPFGLYERLVTAGLKAQLLRFDPASTRVVKEELEPTEAHVTLVRHIEEVVARALADLPHEDRAARQSQLASQIISLLGTKPTEARFHEDLVENPPEQLRAIQPISGVPNDPGYRRATRRALSASDLLVNARHEPGLAHALSHEIPSADAMGACRHRVRGAEVQSARETPNAAERGYVRRRRTRPVDGPW
jgi:hypothetical protein